MSTGETRRAEDGRHRGLGRGLSALIGEEAPVAPAPDGGARGHRTLPLARLKPNPFQPQNLRAGGASGTCEFCPREGRVAADSGAATRTRNVRDRGGRATLAGGTARQTARRAGGGSRTVGRGVTGTCDRGKRPAFRSER